MPGRDPAAYSCDFGRASSFGPRSQKPSLALRLSRGARVSHVSGGRRGGTCPQVMDILRILHLNSMLTGGGTDDQCVRLAAGLHQLGQKVWVAGPEGREFSKIIRSLEVPFHVTPPEGLLKLRFIASAAKLIRRE